jgi:tetratricopeptide (TPR) repeat protein
MVSKDPSDLYYAAGNAVNGKDYETAIKYYQTLIDTDYTGETSEFVATRKETGEVEAFENENVRNIAVKSGEFIKPETRVSESKKGEILRNLTLIYIEQGNNEKAVELMKVARAENPSDVYLMRADADMSYKMGDVERYNELMNKIVESDPENPEIYFNLGVGSAEIGNNEKAIGYYNKALELKPDYESALINIAVLILSGEDELVEQMNSLGNSSADNKKYDALKQERNDLYSETKPYLEKAIKLSPNNPEVMRTLMNIYGQLADDANYKEMKAKLEALEKKGQ